MTSCRISPAEPLPADPFAVPRWYRSRVPIAPGGARPVVRATRLARKGVLLTGSLALALGASACSGGSGSATQHRPPAAGGGTATGGAASIVQRALQATLGQSTALVSESVKIPQGTQPVGSGSVDFARQIAGISNTVTTSSSAPPETVRLVETPVTLYVSIPPTYVPPHQAKPLATLLGGKQWMSYTASSPATGAGVNQAFLDNEAYNPLWLVGALAGASGRVSDQGAATVGGVATTRYSLDISLESAAKRDLFGLRAIFAEDAAFFGVSKVPAQVWIDHKGRVVQLSLQVTFPSSKAEAAASGKAPASRPSATVMLTLSGFGSPVSVTVPPLSNVATQQQVAVATSGAKTGTPAAPSSPSSSSTPSTPPASSGGAGRTYGGSG